MNRMVNGNYVSALVKFMTLHEISDHLKSMFISGSLIFWFI